MRTTTNIGIWARSKSSIIIHNFKSIYRKPKAFIVMQFGKNYKSQKKEMCGK
jgi:hypothetical protein